ncbi:MAG: zinc-dependent peptidase [Planctomycetota bacterium]
MPEQVTKGWPMAYGGDSCCVRDQDAAQQELRPPGIRHLRTVHGIRLALLLALDSCLLGPATAADPQWQTRTIAGWTVHIRDSLLQDEPQATAKALELFTAQLEEIIRVVPAPAVAELRKVPIWFSPDYKGEQPRAEYHPGAGWLRDNGRDPAMAKGVEFSNVRIFERETRRMPNFTLHELAHAYHDRVLPDGFDNPPLKAAFDQAGDRQLYEQVEQRFGDGRSAVVRAYAMTNPMEYFAECSEAFFSTNDFFPFTREQLEKHDPQMFALLKTLWKTEAGPPSKSDEVSWQNWKYSGSLWLLTTPDGAHLPADQQLTNFPVLVRLHRDFLDFSQLLPHGDDLRIATPTGEPLAFQIEHWDADAGTASVWVRVPVIQGNSRQELRLYWGNAAAKGESSGAAVFNESNHYRSVWHLADSVADDVGHTTPEDTGTTSTPGVIGLARHIADNRGISGGEAVAALPVGSGEHSTELWFRTDRMNSTLIGWGNEAGQGKVVMQFRSPPHIRMDCYFSDGNVSSDSRLPRGEWTHVVHTYRQGEATLYINGKADGTSRRSGSPLNIKSPARLYLGGWYNNYDFSGDLDEVRISSTARSPEWIQLQYENQKPAQLLAGMLVQPGSEFSVAPSALTVAENQTATVRIQAGGAQKILWLLTRDGRESLVATDRLSYDFHAGRVAARAAKASAAVASAPPDAPNPLDATLTVKAIYPTHVKSEQIRITLVDDIPEPEFTLTAPAAWDGRHPVEVVPHISNLAAMQAKDAARLNIRWAIDDVAAITTTGTDRLMLNRSLGSGALKVTATLDNGGAPVTRSVTITVQEPPFSQDPWIAQPDPETEQPEDNQFIAREGPAIDGSFGRLRYAGTLPTAADAVFVRVFAGDELFAEETAALTADARYSLTVRLKPGLVSYRTEFGSRTGNCETILHRAGQILCGDAYLIIGQSNAVATDFGRENPLAVNDWVRTFGATAGDPHGARLHLWAPAAARSPGGRSEIGYWGMELGRRLVESEHVPVCFLNGAVGGTRIDQHQRNPEDPTDVNSIYGRLLWRVRQARLTHGIRAVIWHQGENDQGADGPTGGFGYETYRPFFLQLAASWKQDYPNIQHFYAFQIWPKSCAMGINGSDNQLREVQRTLPRLFSCLSVLATVGVKPPGGCHFPAAGYAEFARLLHPMLQHHIYQRPAANFDSPSLQRAFFNSADHSSVVLEFDQPVTWADTLVSQFHLDGEQQQVVAGSAAGNQLTLQLKGPSKSSSITYLDSASWNPENLLSGHNGLAALTFCDVPVAAYAAGTD